MVAMLMYHMAGRRGAEYQIPPPSRCLAGKEELYSVLGQLGLDMVLCSLEDGANGSLLLQGGLYQQPNPLPRGSFRVY